MTEEQPYEFEKVGRANEELAHIPWQKRVVDIALSLLLLALLSPLFVTIGPSSNPPCSVT